jgi:hypothetical protein
MSLTSVDLPEPETPVTATSSPSGNATSRFFRLFARAPRCDLLPFGASRRSAGTAIDFSPERYLPVSDRSYFRSALDRALGDDLAAVLAGARPEVDHVVGRRDRLLVVLDDDHAVAELAQLEQRVDQPPVVALVEADRRLVQDVEDAHQLRADLRGEPDPLRLAARERRGRAVEREVADADVVEEAEPVAHFLQDLAGDLLVARGSRSIGEEDSASFSCIATTCRSSGPPPSRRAPPA